MDFLSKSAVITCSGNNTVAGTGTSNYPVLDMQNFDAIHITLNLGVVTAGAGVELQLQGSDFANGASNTTLATTGNCSLGSANSNQTIQLDVIKPTNRYVYPSIIRSQQNAAIMAVNTIQYLPRSVPITLNANAANTTRTQVQ